MYNIAITGVGGGVGQSILKSLTGTDYNLIGLDGELLGAGLYATPSSYLIPYAKDEKYISTLLDICKKENVHLLFPGLDAELKPLSLHVDQFAAIGTKVIVSAPEVVSISDDKQLTYDKLTKFGVNVPFTTSLRNYSPKEVDFPLIIKQKVGGARSKNIFLTRNLTDWENALSKIGQHQDDYIVMEYIEGDEYTCGTINLDGVCKGVIVMRRILRDGDTHKCFTVNDKVIEKQVRQVVENIKPFGACNVQLRVKNGIPYVFEINARCSGTTAARTLSGFNEPKMIADFLLKGIEPTYQIKEQTILRYWKELVVENSEVEELKTKRYIKSDFQNNKL